MKKLLKIFVLAIVLILSMSLFACNLDLGDDKNDPVVYSTSNNGASYTLKLFPDYTFDLNYTNNNGINSTVTVLKGNYTVGNGEYSISTNKYETTSYTFGLPYQTMTASAEDLEDMNTDSMKVSIISDDICMINGIFLFKNGEKGSPNIVAKVISPYKAAGLDYDFTCSVNGTIANQYLIKYYADASQERIYITEEMLGEHDFSTPGAKYVEITYAENKVYQAKVQVASNVTPYFSCSNRLPLNTTIEAFRADTSNYISLSGHKIYFTDENVQIVDFDTTKDEKITIKITYQDFSKEKEIIIYNPENLKIETFNVNIGIGVAMGSDLSFTGNVTKNDGSNHMVTPDIAVADYDKNKLLPQVVSFTYQGNTVKKVVYVYDITNKDVVLNTSVERKNAEAPAYVTYVDGALDLSQHELVLEMVDGSSQKVALTNSMFSSFDPKNFYNNNYQYVYISYTHTGYTYYLEVIINKG